MRGCGSIARLAGALLAAALSMAAGARVGVAEPVPIAIGIDGDFEGSLRDASRAALQGAEAAAAEINAAGGIGGRPLRLVARDHRGNPRRALDDFLEGVAREGLVATISVGQSNPAIALLEAAAARRIPVVSAFPASTRLVQNGLTPNPAFRVSQRDDRLGTMLVGEALRAGRRRVGLLLENSEIGKSSFEAIEAALKAEGVEGAHHVGWFSLAIDDFPAALAAALASGADALILVAKPPQGAALLEAVAAAPEATRPLVLLHPSVAASGGFAGRAAAFAGVDYRAIQTFGFDAPHDPAAAARLLAQTCRLHGLCDARDVRSPGPLAQGYDAVMLVALGLRRTAEGAAPDLLAALDALPPHAGVIRRYDPAFGPARRDALDLEDFFFARFVEGGRPVPVGAPANGMAAR